jgi:hypothetical protein
MSFINSITSFFVEPDEEDEVPQEINRNIPVPEMDGTGDDPEDLPDSLENLILPSAVQQKSVVNAPDSGSQVQTPLPEEEIPRSPSIFNRVRMIFSKPPQQDITTLMFDHGELSVPLSKAP